jgi:cell division protease FtsH
MATQFGMSDKLGPLLYGENQQEVFLGHSVAQSQSVSEATQQMVDEEVKAFVDQGYQTAQKIITDHIDDLHTIAQGLLEYESLSGDEIQGLVDGKPPVREDDTDDTPTRSRGSAVPSAGGKPKDKGDGAVGDMEPQPS